MHFEIKKLENNYLLWFVRFLSAGHSSQSASPRNLPNLSKSSKYFFIYIYLFDLSRFVRFLSAGHSLPVGFAEKSYKSFQILQIFFHLYLFVRFIPDLQNFCPQGTPPSVGCAENLSKSSILHKLNFVYFSCDFVAVIPFRIQAIRTEIYQHTIR